MVDGQSPAASASINYQLKTINFLQKPGARIFDRSISFAGVDAGSVKESERALTLPRRTGKCQSGPDREKTSSQKEE
jgi:hypothetical protein